MRIFLLVLLLLSGCASPLPEATELNEGRDNLVKGFEIRKQLELDIAKQDTEAVKRDSVAAYQKFSAAYDNYVNCVSLSGRPSCMSMAANMQLTRWHVGRLQAEYYSSHNIAETELIIQPISKIKEMVDTAMRWMTLAARYGDSTAIAYLTANGLPLPVADLKQQQQSNTTNNAILNNALIGIGLGMASGGAPQQTRGYCAFDQFGNKIRCVSSLIECRQWIQSGGQCSPQ